jgi:hypothetical protein
MTQVVTIASCADTFTATCDACGTPFAGRLDGDLGEGVFLCRFGHAVHIVRSAPPEEDPAAATAA